MTLIMTTVPVASDTFHRVVKRTSNYSINSSSVEQLSSSSSSKSSTRDVLRMDLLFLHDRRRGPFSTGTTRRAPGQVGGRSARRKRPLGVSNFDDEADSIVSLVADDSSPLPTSCCLSGTRSGAEFSFFSPW